MGLGAHGDGPDARPLRRRAAAALHPLLLAHHALGPRRGAARLPRRGLRDRHDADRQLAGLVDRRQPRHPLQAGPLLPQGVHGRTSDPLGPCLHRRSRALRALPQRRAGRRPPSRPALYALRPPQPLRHLRRHAAAARGGRTPSAYCSAMDGTTTSRVRSGTSSGPRGATARPSASTCASSTTTAAKRQ